MKCNKCGAEWKVDAGRSASITVCPFCQEKIAADKSGEWKYFDNTKELLEYVAAEYGNDALFGRKYFSDHSAPLMPQGQKNLVKQAFECGAVKAIQDNVNSDQQHKDIAVKQAVGKLIDTYASAKEAAERVVWEFTNAIGWAMQEPTSKPQNRNNQQNVTVTQIKNVNNPPLPPQNSGLDSLMQLASICLLNGDWQEAEDYYKDVLKLSPQYAPAWIGRLCVDLKISKEEKLTTVDNPNTLADHKFFKTALQFADSGVHPLLTRLLVRALLTGINVAAEKKAVVEKAEEKRRIADEAARRKRVQAAFDNACKIMDAAQIPDDYRNAMAAFGSIDSIYQDINTKIMNKVAECKRFGQEMQQRYDVDYEVWREKTQQLKTQYDAQYKQWQIETKEIKEKSKTWKFQGLCIHCGGKIGLFGSCKECKKKENDPLIIKSQPSQPNYPPEPYK